MVVKIGRLNNSMLTLTAQISMDCAREITYVLSNQSGANSKNLTCSPYNV